MSARVPPPVVFDTDVLLTLVCDQTAQDAVMNTLRGRRIVTTAVADETLYAGQGTALTRSGLLGHARRLVVKKMEIIEVTALGEDAIERMVRLQASLARPGDSNRKHLGEASSIAAAVALKAVFLTHDRDAVALARQEGVPTAGVTELLTVAIRSGNLTTEQRAFAETQMNKKGRHPPPSR